MKGAAEFDELRPGLWCWQMYEPAVKTDLTCCAVQTREGLVFCDPAPLQAQALEELAEKSEPCGIILTNANHERNAAAVAKKFGIEIWASEGARGEVAATRWFQSGEKLFGEIETVPLDGFAPGETALWVRGALIVGDALINVPPYGFAMLPEKYCEDAKLGRKSLGRLLNYFPGVLCFAHGLPIVTNARERLAELIATC